MGWADAKYMVSAQGITVDNVLSCLEKIDVFRTVMERLGSIFTNKFSEDQPERLVLQW